MLKPLLNHSITIFYPPDNPRLTIIRHHYTHLNEYNPQYIYDCIMTQYIYPFNNHYISILGYTPFSDLPISSVRLCSSPPPPHRWRVSWSPHADRVRRPSAASAEPGWRWAIDWWPKPQMAFFLGMADPKLENVGKNVGKHIFGW